MRARWRIATLAGVSLAALAIAARLSKTLRRTAPQGDPIHELAGILTRRRQLPEILSAIEDCFASALGFPFAVFLREGDQLRMGRHSSGFEPAIRDFASAERAIAVEHWLTELRGKDRYYFLPLKTWRGTVGAFGLRMPGTSAPVDPGTWALVEAFAHQTSLAILRLTFEDGARQAELLTQADKLQKALLNSIAHNVRTPLASIIGSLSALQEQELSMDQTARRDLIDTAREEAERLNRLLGNLLDLSRLEAGALRIRKDPCDVQDVIGAALEQLGRAVDNRQVQVIIAPEPAFVPMDFVLIVQVLVNLLDNALKYSPADTSITVEACVLPEKLKICVSDFGPGIAEADLGRVFEKFHRGGRSIETGGIGLGLSICKGLIEAHHGKIWAERRPPGGTAVTFTLPIQQEA